MIETFYSVDHVLLFVIFRYVGESWLHHFGQAFDGYFQEMLRQRKVVILCDFIYDEEERDKEIWVADLL